MQTAYSEGCTAYRPTWLAIGALARLIGVRSPPRMLHALILDIGPKLLLGSHPSDDEASQHDKGAATTKTPTRTDVRIECILPMSLPKSMAGRSLNGCFPTTSKD